MKVLVVIGLLLIGCYFSLKLLSTSKALDNDLMSSNMANNTNNTNLNALMNLSNSAEEREEEANTVLIPFENRTNSSINYLEPTFNETSDNLTETNSTSNENEPLINNTLINNTSSSNSSSTNETETMVLDTSRVSGMLSPEDVRTNNNTMEIYTNSNSTNNTTTSEDNNNAQPSVMTAMSMSLRSNYTNMNNTNTNDTQPIPIENSSREESVILVPPPVNNYTNTSYNNAMLTSDNLINTNMHLASNSALSNVTSGNMSNSHSLTNLLPSSNSTVITNSEPTVSNIPIITPLSTVVPENQPFNSTNIPISSAPMNNNSLNNNSLILPPNEIIRSTPITPLNNNTAVPTDNIIISIPVNPINSNSTNVTIMPSSNSTNVSATSPTNNNTSLLNSTNSNTTLGLPFSADHFNITDYISPLFFTTYSNNIRPGKEYIALTTADGYLFMCNSYGQVVLSYGYYISSQYMWVPVVDFKNNKLLLKNLWSKGYMKYDGTRWMCNSKEANKTTEFNVDKNFNLTSLNVRAKDMKEAMALKFDFGYLSVTNGIIGVSNKIDRNSILIAPYRISELSMFRGPYSFEKIQ